MELTEEEEEEEDNVVCSTRDVVASIALAVGVVVVVVVVGVSEFGTGLVMLEGVDSLRVAASELSVASVVAEVAADLPFRCLRKASHSERCCLLLGRLQSCPD